MKKSLLARVPEFAKAPFREALGREHPAGLARAEEQRLRRLPRYVAGTTRLFGRPFRFCDAASFLSAHDEIFRRRLYRFDPAERAPRIVDGGANIGLATLFFARTVPGARILAVEADPGIVDVLQANVQTYEVPDVEVVHGALWDQPGELSFAPDHADGGGVAEGGALRVPSLLLSDVIGDDPVAMLKLDIEGAESRVLTEAAGRLGLVERVFVEYHSRPGQPQTLGSLLRILEEAGFRYHAEDASIIRSQPFLTHEPLGEFDFQANVFAWREGPAGQ